MLWILDWRLLVVGLTTKLIFRCTRVTLPNVGPDGSCCFTLCITDIHHWMFEKGANSNYWYYSYMWCYLPLYGLLELSSNSRWLLVRSWWFCIQVLACLGSFWCMLGGSVEVHEVLTWVWSSMNRNRLLSFKFKHYLQSGKIELFLCAQQPMDNQWGQTLNEKSHWVEG